MEVVSHCRRVRCWNKLSGRLVHCCSSQSFYSKKSSQLIRLVHKLSNGKNKITSRSRCRIKTSSSENLHLSYLEISISPSKLEKYLRNGPSALLLPTVAVKYPTISREQEKEGGREMKILQTLAHKFKKIRSFCCLTGNFTSVFFLISLFKIAGRSPLD